MKVGWQLALVTVLVGCLQVNCRRINSPFTTTNERRLKELVQPLNPFEYLVVMSSNKNGAVLSEHVAKPSQLRYSSRSMNTGSRTGVFRDIWPYIGSFVYRTTVRRVFVQPAFRAMKRLVPNSTSFYITESINKKYIDMFSPLQPMISSYAYKKMEQGALWSLHQGFNLLRNYFLQRQ